MARQESPKCPRRVGMRLDSATNRARSEFAHRRRSLFCFNILEIRHLRRLKRVKPGYEWAYPGQDRVFQPAYCQLMALFDHFHPDIPRHSPGHPLAFFCSYFPICVHPRQNVRSLEFLWSLDFGDWNFPDSALRTRHSALRLPSTLNSPSINHVRHASCFGCVASSKFRRKLIRELFLLGIGGDSQAISLPCRDGHHIAQTRWYFRTIVPPPDHSAIFL